MNRSNEGRKVRIAVIDDDDSFRAALLRLFFASGYEAVGYSSAEEFLQDTNRMHVQCLVLDINLGGMTGFELQKTLSAQQCTLPIIFVSGHNRSEIAGLKTQTGSFDFFSKPVPTKMLLDKISLLVEQKVAEV